MTGCVKRIDFNVCGDERGSLVALEKGCNLPFDVKRVYYIFGTGPDVTRGCHAHKNLKQMLVALSGRVDVTCEYGDRTETFTLDDPASGLLIEGRVWRTMTGFAPGTVLMVLASEYYSEADYIRDYGTFLKKK